LTLIGVEHAARELLRLAAEPRWSREETRAAYGHMRTLRASGFRNEDISKLTRGRWTTAAVKKATAGTTVSTPEDARTVMTVLTEVLAENIPLPDLQSATTLYHQIGSQLPDVLDLLNQLTLHKIPVKDFLDDYAKMKAQGLNPQTLKQVLNYKDDLEKEHLNIAALTQVKAVAEKYGDFAKVMVALEAYGSLGAVQRETEARKKELEDTNRLLEPAKQQLKVHRDLEEASKGLLKSYQDLQKNLTDAITKMPTDLTTALNNVSTNFKEKTDEQLKDLSKKMSESATKELEETSKSLTSLKGQFNDSKKDLAETVKNAVNAALESVKSIVTKGTESVTQIEKDYKAVVDSSQKQTTDTLESLDNKLKEIRENLEVGQQKLQDTITNATADSTKQIHDLASHALEVGKKFNELETAYRQNQPYLELAYLSNRQFGSITPHVLSTMKTVLRGFVQWLETSPASVRSPNVIANSGRKLLEDLNKELPDV